MECGAVLRRWELNAVLPGDAIATAVSELKAWPLRVAQVRGLLDDAWRLRFNLTVADALYVALAEHLGARVLTDDGHMVNAPGLPVGTLYLA